MIRLLVPDMPTADDLLPWLRMIDETRVYSNNGPLVAKLEDQLSNITGAPTVAVSTGTAAIELALRALRLPPGSRVIVPAVTFAATGLAVLNAGLEPVLCDVDPTSWQLTTTTAWEAMRRFDARAVVPVATFGMPVPLFAWEQFANRTGVPVVIDAAGALLSDVASDHPGVVTCYSLHATKFIGCGEGGAVASSDPGLREDVRALSAFGGGGIVPAVGTNAKMSEYHAAVALAALEPAAVQRKRERMLPVATAYTHLLHGAHGVTMQRMPSLLSSILVVRLPQRCYAPAVIGHLWSMGIEAKQWYRPFLPEHPATRHCQWFGALPVTGQLACSLIGLPYHAGLSPDDIAHVCAILADAVGTTPTAA